MVAATIWNTYYVLTDYLSYPVNVNIEVSNQPTVPFPTVTVCNRNPLSCRRLAYAYVAHKDELKDLMYHSGCSRIYGFHPWVSRLVSTV
jgi:hypothetical protein